MNGVSWVVLAGLIRALAVFAPVGGKSGEELQKLMLIAASLLERGEAGRHELEKLTAKLEEMVAQGREPKPEEWAASRARSDAAHDAIQKAAGVSPTPESPAPAADSEGGATD
jgi:hypothetical protein